MRGGIPEGAGAKSLRIGCFIHYHSPASASAEKPPKTTVWIAPIRAHASMAMGSSKTIGMYMATVSPFLTPFDLSQLDCAGV